MAANNHRSFMAFLRRAIDVAIGYSKDDLLAFRAVAMREHHAFLPLIDAYLSLTDSADSEVVEMTSKSGWRAAKRPTDMHLFDLLRERRLFPSNADLSDFAARILPSMRRYRFDKMSKGDIAARIIEYLETRDPSTKARLESSMRQALASSDRKRVDKKSFFSEWEKIIKGIEL